MIPPLYFTDPIEGRDRSGRKVAPDFGVNVESVIDTKRRMLLCHASQARWEVKQHGIDNFVAAMEAWTKKRGKSVGVTYAEGFRQIHRPSLSTRQRICRISSAPRFACPKAIGPAL